MLSASLNKTFPSTPLFLFLLGFCFVCLLLFVVVAFVVFCVFLNYVYETYTLIKKMHVKFLVYERVLKVSTNRKKLGDCPGYGN